MITVIIIQCTCAVAERAPTAVCKNTSHNNAKNMEQLRKHGSVKQRASLWIKYHTLQQATVLFYIVFMPNTDKTKFTRTTSITLLITQAGTVHCYLLWLRISENASRVKTLKQRLTMPVRWRIQGSSRGRGVRTPFHGCNKVISLCLLIFSLSSLFSWFLDNRRSILQNYVTVAYRVGQKSEPLMLYT